MKRGPSLGCIGFAALLLAAAMFAGSVVDRGERDRSGDEAVAAMGRFLGAMARADVAAARRETVHIPAADLEAATRVLQGIWGNEGPPATLRWSTGSDVPVVTRRVVGRDGKEREIVAGFTRSSGWKIHWVTADGAEVLPLPEHAEEPSRFWTDVELAGREDAGEAWFVRYRIDARGMEGSRSGRFVSCSLSLSAVVTDPAGGDHRWAGFTVRWENDPDKPRQQQVEYPLTIPKSWGAGRYAIEFRVADREDRGRESIRTVFLDLP